MEGWHLGPSMSHYQCFRVYIKKTGAERVVDTLTWITTNEQDYSHLPICTQLQEAIATIQDGLTTTSQSPTYEYKRDFIDALQDLSILFKRQYQKYVDTPQTIHVPTTMSNRNNIPHEQTSEGVAHNILPQSMTPTHQINKRRIQPQCTAKMLSPYAGTVMCPTTGAPLEY